MAALQTQLNSAVAACLPFMTERVTFARQSVTTDTSGGHTRSSVDTTPSSIPCALRPAKAGEARILGERVIKGTLYMLILPAQFGSVVVDVDTSCNAVVAASAIESARTLHIEWVGRAAGAVIKLLASLET